MIVMPAANGMATPIQSQADARLHTLSAYRVGYNYISSIYFVVKYGISALCMSEPTKICV